MFMNVWHMKGGEFSLWYDGKLSSGIKKCKKNSSRFLGARGMSRALFALTAFAVLVDGE